MKKKYKKDKTLVTTKEINRLKAHHIDNSLDKLFGKVIRDPCWTRR